VGLHTARLGMRRRAIYLSAGESSLPKSNGADQTPLERRGASGALGRAELLKGVAGTGLGEGQGIIRSCDLIMKGLIAEVTSDACL
jgi:hypothetical protein